ncbi:hypothetical protein [Tessaracoccus massiliensis]|uniref:hypothetical protein n=1 Tax=Tessaracoccus massiliensis TaxID=1522311 RepID=UPI00058CBE7F|nr:hypothetical protein [Tessaracoccus massiliensis]
MKVDDLKSFNEGDWMEAAAGFEEDASDKATYADKLDGTAGVIESQWRDEVGDMSAARHREHAEAVRDVIPIYEGAAQTVRDAASEMVARRGNLEDLLAFAQKHDIVVTNGGTTFPSPRALVDHAHELPKLFALNRAVGARIRLVLQMAAAADGRAALALLAVLRIDLPYFDGGPLDMSDEGIREQIALSAQGDYGFCAFLSPLMALGEANPDVIRDNVRWDPGTDSYVVTLHDPETGERIEVNVDPRDIPRNAAGELEGADNTYTGEPNFLSIYEQAVRQQFPERKSYDFPTSVKIITGRDVDEVRAEHTSLDEIRQVREANPPGAVMVATTGAVETQNYETVPPEKFVVPGHAYTVDHVTEDGMIVLNNTWGPEGGSFEYPKDSGNFHHGPGQITLTEEEYQRWMNGTMMVENP